MADGGTQSNLVLIVDDEPSICTMLHKKLTNSGFECITCSCGKEAIEKLEKGVIALVLSDLRMPGMSGMELLDQVKRISPHTKFMMITGDDDVHVGVEAMKNGALDYLVKPLQLASVVASVERAMKARRMELEIEDYKTNLERMVDERTKNMEMALKRVELTCDESLEALGGALDLRDTETAGHSERVSRYSIQIARVLGCTNEQLKDIARGAYLHDIGKIGIRDAILMKPSKLGEEEKAEMQKHVQIGYDLVSRIEFLKNAAEIVLAHHERYDGMGYPERLSGEQIPLGARIFAVADTLDAMTSDRPYRQALPFPAAKAEIVRESGHQFDPKVVQAFLSVPERVWDNIRRSVAEGWTGSKMTLSSDLNSDLPEPTRRII